MIKDEHIIWIDRSDLKPDAEGLRDPYAYCPPCQLLSFSKIHVHVRASLSLQNGVATVVECGEIPTRLKFN